MFVKRLVEKYLQELSETEMITWRSEYSLSENTESYRDMMEYFLAGFLTWLDNENYVQQSVQRIAFGGGAAGLLVGVIVTLILVFVLIGIR